MTGRLTDKCRPGTATRQSDLGAFIVEERHLHRQARPRSTNVAPPSRARRRRAATVRTNELRLGSHRAAGDVLEPGDHRLGQVDACDSTRAVREQRTYDADAGAPLRLAEGEFAEAEEQRAERDQRPATSGIASNGCRAGRADDQNSP